MAKPDESSPATLTQRKKPAGSADPPPAAAAAATAPSTEASKKRKLQRREPYWRRLCKAFALIAAAVTIYASKTLYDAGEFKSLAFNSTDPCGYWKPGVLGFEDLAWLDSDHAVLTSDPRHYFSLGQKAALNLSMRIAQQKVGQAVEESSTDLITPHTHGQEQGQLWLLPYSEAEKIAKQQGGAATPLAIVDDPFPDFHPHGIDSYRTADGKILLFVVQHRRSGEGISIYELDPERKTAKHVENIQNPVFRGLNDVAVANENEFYTTNWLYYEMGTWGNLYELYLQRRSGYLIQCRRAQAKAPWKCEKILDRLAMPNGVILSAKRDKIYFTATIQKALLEYYHTEQGELHFYGETNINSGCDNVAMDESGRVWMACHSKMLTQNLYQRGILSAAPTEVIVFDTESGSFSTELVTDGQQLSAASGAYPMKDLFVLGSVKDDGIAVCHRKVFLPPQ